jgi:uncharacterized protein (TIGR02145 family)
MKSLNLASLSWKVLFILFLNIQYLTVIHAQICDSSTMVASLQDTLTAPGSVLLGWNAADDAVSYRLKGRRLGTSIWRYIAASGTHYSVSGLVTGDGFEWSVSPECTGGVAGAWSVPDTFYVADFDFVCGDTLIDPRDGLRYPTTALAGKCWTSENLRYHSGGYGFDLGTGTYHPDSAGAFYGWPNAVGLSAEYDSILLDQEGMRGMCMPGWHISTSGEWDLIDSVPGITSFDLLAGGSTGLNVVMRGYRNSVNNYVNSGVGTIFLSSTEKGPNKFHARIIIKDNPAIDHDYIIKWCGVSLRCVMD